MGDKNKHREIPCRIAPCANCPFLKNTPRGWLAHRIESDVQSDSFVCHKDNSLQCAGHMLLLGSSNLIVRLASALNIDLGLQGRDKVFDTPDDCIKHHKDL